MYSTSQNSYGSNYAGSGYSASPLENLVSTYSVENSAGPIPQYVMKTGSYESYNSVAEEQPVFFLNPQRPSTPFIGKSAEISEQVQEAFRLTTAVDLPQDIIITIASREQLMQSNLAFIKESVIGLSINATREIFVVAGNMDEVMLTIGHELGHIIKEPARTPQEEEAKAFAFEAAWAKTIFEHDVAGLKASINSASLAPARNGLHDVAFNFVQNNKSEPLKLFDNLSSGRITSQQIFEGTQVESATPILKSPLYSLPKSNKTKLYGGYLNKSRVQNLPPPHNFFWDDLGRGIYGMFVPMTSVETLNSELLRKDIEQMHKTMGHEYSLHNVMGLPDGYVVEALEEAMFWTAEEDDKYRP